MTKCPICGKELVFAESVLSMYCSNCKKYVDDARKDKYLPHCCCVDITVDDIKDIECDKS